LPGKCWHFSPRLVHCSLSFPGEGPFLGVIDMFGEDGGLVEYRSSLLASRGFASLALPYFAFGDLPPAMSEFHLEYFEEVANFVIRHPKVRGSGVGVTASGKGSDPALSMITFLPQVIAAVSVSGCCANTAAPLSYKDFTIPALAYDMSRDQISETAVFDISEALDDPLDPANSQCLIPVEKAQGSFMFVGGEDDLNWKSSVYAMATMSCLQQSGKSNYNLLSYPGAGHQIDPPSSPFCPVAVNRVLGVPILGGGELKAHCHAQEDSWQKIQDFFLDALKIKTEKKCPALVLRYLCEEAQSHHFKIWSLLLCSDQKKNNFVGLLI
ncbi:acyl-coenzyme A thioesterase 6-like, partial [Ranitomeya imitator]|uniref:acyl-coenzyme A thioesterase 6-like n=1 Tax=Ranitomeya imitator TaxID=111125 RepID=UPI0037E915B8